MKLGVFMVFLAITVLVTATFTCGIAGDNGIIVGGFALAAGCFGLGRMSRGKNV